MCKKQNIFIWNITSNPQGIFWIHKMIGLESTRETKIEKKKKTMFIYLLIWMIELLKKKKKL